MLQPEAGQARHEVELGRPGVAHLGRARLHAAVLEGPTTAFVCSFDGETLVTPPLSEHILDSITRRRLFAVCDVEEQVIARDDLAGVREAFMASTMREVHPVRAIDEMRFDAPGPLTREAAARIRAHIEQELGVSAA